MPECNTTLSTQRLGVDVFETPLWRDFTFHHLGLLLSGSFGLLALLIALTLILLHATHYSRPAEQRHIIRILLLIPVYASVSFLSYVFYWHAIYFDIVEGCYEAFAISSFFSLMCAYVAPNLHEQKEFFRGLVPVNWFWGVFGLQKCTGGAERGWLRRPRSGLTWFNVIWIGIFQYCLIRVLFTIVAVVAQVFGDYCEESLHPAFAHVWVQGFEAVSVTVAMFFLVQFYIQLKEELAEHRPFLKVLCIKLVIFFSFWQTIVISFASSDRGPLQPTDTLAYPDIKVGIPSTLLCIEMAIFAIMHIFAFPWRPYSAKHSLEASYGPVRTEYAGGFLGWRALVDAFNPWDIVKMTARGLRWLFVGHRHRHHDVSYQKTTLAESTVLSGAAGSATELSGGYQKEEGSLQPWSGDAVGAGGGGREDDRAGLLAHQGEVQRMPSVSPQRGGDDEGYGYVPYSNPRLDVSAPERARAPGSP